MKKRFTILYILAFAAILFACEEKDEIIPEAEACFNYSPSEELLEGAEISFTNCSENASSYAWSFGDGNSSTEKDPRHIYSTAGEYAIELQVSNESGTRTVIKSIVIDPVPIAKACFEYSPAEQLMVGTEINFTNCSENASDYEWNFGDGNSSSDENPMHSFDMAGEYTIELNAINENNSESITKTIVILPLVDSTGLNSTPEAFVEHDSKSGGIYKGILVGSSGAIKIILQAGNPYVEITFDGESRTLTTADLTGWESGNSISSAVFSMGDWSISFSVDANGDNPEVIPTIPGHAAFASVQKETSTGLVKAFEGSYGGDASGIWNCVIRESTLTGIRKWEGNGESVSMSGSVNNNIISGHNFSGEVSGNRVSGIWNQDAIEGVVDALSGTFSGVRTM